MCHHRADIGEAYWADERETEEEPDETFAPESTDDPAVDVELDREYDESEVKTPGDD